MEFQYVCSRIKDLAKDLKDAKAFDDEHAFESDLKALRRVLQTLAEQIRQERKDSAFFEKELEVTEEPEQVIGAHVTEEKEDSCDHVRAFRERRQKRKDGRCVESFRKRRQERLDAKEEDGRWVTTENDHKIHLNEEGVPDMGNPFRH